MTDCASSKCEDKFTSHKKGGVGASINSGSLTTFNNLQKSMLLQDIAIHKQFKHNRAMLYGWCDIGDCSSFNNSLPHLAFQFDWKISNFDSSLQRLYSTALLSSLCLPWSTGTFWHCFATSTVVS